MLQLYQDTFDAAVQMYDKLINKIYNRADNEVNAYLKKHRRKIRTSLGHYRQILDVLLDAGIKAESVRQTIYTQINLQALKTEYEQMNALLNSKHQRTFDRVIARHSYLRQFAPALVKHLQFQAEPGDKTTAHLLDAVDVLNKMNQDGLYKLPGDALIT